MQAKAGFFSSIFGMDASANIEEVSIQETDATSQSRDLSLQANVSSVLVDNKDLVKEGINVNIVSDNALLPSMGVMGGADGGDVSFDQISVYVIRKDDSISKIAEMFNVSENTILWANDMKKGDKLVEGETLFILPISGVKHTVVKGQTLKGIAKLYQVDVIDIAGFNGIASDTKLIVGDELIIPDAEMSDEGSNKVASKSSSKEVIKKNTGKDLGGYFINPVPNYRRISQRIHGKNGVDLAASTGTKIVATASGKVLLARNGYNGGYGNMTIIQHPNGTQTLYAHQSKLAVHTGDHVSQGEVIGYVGSTGRSTGPHLHYEVHGAKNNAVSLSTYN
ncbi:MAG: peptidoglycan DD-metalloendopeptidase family protein [Candidatus Paceibacterota bacterium]|jgi:LysM repeat protein